MSSPFSTGMGDRLRAGIPPWYVTKPTRSTQPCIPQVPVLIGWGKGGNVTSAGWQVTLCDPVWHVSSRSGAVLVAQTAIRFLTTTDYDHLSEFQVAEEAAHVCLKYDTAGLHLLELATIVPTADCFLHQH